MGYIRHHAVVVTSWDDDLLDEARNKAVELFSQARASAFVEAGGMERLVSPIVEGVMNGFRSFFVAPDGSKEFWEHSNLAERARTAFVEWLATQRYPDGSSSLHWVEVQFGDDYGPPKVLRHDDEELV